MDPWAVLLVAVGLILLVAAWLVVDVLGEATADAIRGALFRRPGFRERRGRARSWLFSGVLSFWISVGAGLFAVAALTSGEPADKDDGFLFAGAAVGLFLLALALLVTWWRLAGRPRHY